MRYVRLKCNGTRHFTAKGPRNETYSSNFILPTSRITWLVSLTRSNQSILVCSKKISGMYKTEEWAEKEINKHVIDVPELNRGDVFEVVTADKSVENEGVFPLEYVYGVID